MSAKNQGGDAFPHQPAFDANNERLLYEASGMTLRQYYKAAIIQGMLSNPECGSDNNKLARFSGIIADALLAEDEEAGK